MKCYGKAGLIIQKTKHTSGFEVFCVKMINQTLQETLANHVHVGLMCTSEIIKVWKFFFKENGMINNAHSSVDSHQQFGVFEHVFRDNCERWVTVASAPDQLQAEEYGRMKKENSLLCVIGSDMGIN